MNVVFHTLSSFGIAHVAARGLDDRAPSAFEPRDARVLVPAFVAGVLSHGVLDGLKHGYPIPYTLDPPLALGLLTAWLALVGRRWRVVVLATFLGAVLPDVIDLGPGVARYLLKLPPQRQPHLFPWHWLDGSGSMYPAKANAVATCRPTLDGGDNQVVSITNHVIVVFLAAAAVLSNTRPFRWNGARVQS